MELKRNVVMLPTNKKAVKQGQLVIGAGHYLFASRESDNIGNLDAQELYITSDEEIKKGDWYIDDTNDVRQSVTSDDIYWKSRTDYKKIIATTDKSIAIEYDVLSIRQRRGLTNNYPIERVIIPVPSKGFIAKFIERYNAGKPITEVMVEYEESCCDIKVQGGVNSPDCCHKHAVRLKVDSNNCITIKAVKESWTREEVSTIIHNICGTMYKANTLYAPHNVQKWIDQNL